MQCPLPREHCERQEAVEASAPSDHGMGFKDSEKEIQFMNLLFTLQISCTIYVLNFYHVTFN